jgi:hypothetical protein
VPSRYHYHHIFNILNEYKLAIVRKKISAVNTFQFGSFNGSCGYSEETTAYLRLKLSLHPDEHSCCEKMSNMEKKLIKEAELLVWDECATIHKLSWEETDRAFKNLTGIQQPLGTKLEGLETDAETSQMYCPGHTLFSAYSICCINILKDLVIAKTTLLISCRNVNFVELCFGNDN